MIGSMVRSFKVRNLVNFVSVRREVRHSRLMNIPSLIKMGDILHCTDAYLVTGKYRVFLYVANNKLRYSRKTMMDSIKMICKK